MQTYLIDGYNLLHAMGILSGRVGPHGLEKARLNLIGVLAGSFGKEADRVTVVFDAASTPRGVKPRQEFQGITVLFAQGQEADDLIETLIREHTSPKKLAVVSDDHRLQRAARRRDAVPMSCSDFLDLLEQRRQAPAAASADLAPSAEKDETADAQDAQHWLKEFGEVQRELDRHDQIELPPKLPPPAAGS